VALHTIVFVPAAEVPSAGELLRSARSRSSLSQEELAARAGVPRSMISAYERGLRQATLPTLVRLLRAAGFELVARIVPLRDTDAAVRDLEAQFGADEQEAWEVVTRSESTDEARHRRGRSAQAPDHNRHQRGQGT